MDPGAYLRSQAPFDQVAAADLEPLERALEVVFLAAGTRILERGGTPAAHLFLVRSGGVRLERENGVVLLVEEGELFGYRSLLTGEAPTFDAWADTDVLCYRFPAAAARAVLEHPAVAATLARGLAERLRGGGTTTLAAPFAAEAGLAAPVRTLITRAPLVVEPGTPVAEAARIMRDAGASSVLVAPGAGSGGGTSGLGILTDRDLRNRVVAQSRPPATPVADVASFPALTLPATTPLLEAVMFMLEHDVHHLPLTDAGRLVGLISDTDVLRRQAHSPLYVLRSVERAETPDVLSGYGTELSRVVRHLSATGVDATAIGRIVSALNDTLARALLRLAERRLGAPPAPYAWIVLGSEGRLEQTLLTDQDNALVYAGSGPSAPGDDEVDTWFARLAEEVIGGLVAAGFPPCPGGFMATRWHDPLKRWTGRFEDWIAKPEPQALMEAAIFFDFRKVAGGLDLEPLDLILDRAAGAGLFLAHLAASAASFRPPLGQFRRIVTKDGPIDVKRGGVAPVVALARVYALAAGSRARPTLERLDAAVAAGTLSRDGGDDLAEAFRFMLSVRLAAQLDELAQGRPLDNEIELDRLAPLERHYLKDALVAIRDGLDGLELTYQSGRLR